MIRHNNTNQLRDLMNDTQNVPPALETRLMEYVLGLLKKGLTHREICEWCGVTRDAIYRAQRNQPIRTITHWASYGSRGMKKPHAQQKRK